ncbi:hypothetical protein K2Y00_03300 [Patescibacteria group bacterium]|nr:hypothetical protein [Patescibacteria group bacterium]
MSYIPETERFRHDPERHVIFASQREKDDTLDQALETIRVKRIDLEAALEGKDDARITEARAQVTAAETFFEDMKKGVVVPPLATPSWRKPKKK